MVEAIGSATSQQIKPIKKDNSIDWKNCTAGEIREYEKEGQEVPDYILQWAQEIEKIESAPDDITYEMAISSNLMQGAPQAVNGEQAKEEAQKVEGTEAAENPSVAKALKTSLDNNNVSITEQGRIFMDTSNQYNDEISQAMQEMEGYLAQSEAAVEAAENTKNDILSRVQSLIERKNSLKAKKGDTAAILESQRLSNQIKSIGQEGLSAISNSAMPIDNTANIISDAQYTSATGRDVGAQTVSIGEQMPNGMPIISMKQFVINAGEAVIEKSTAGDAQFTQNQQENNDFGTLVAGKKAEVSRATGASEKSETEETEGSEDENNAEENNNSTVKDAEQDQIKSESDTKQNELAEQTPETIDEKITTDPNEILKRKERRGLA